MKDIKDFIHLYLGCECMHKYVDWNGWSGPLTIKGYLIEKLHNDLSSEIKPILRPLSDITEEEFNEMFYNMNDPR